MKTLVSLYAGLSGQAREVIAEIYAKRSPGRPPKTQQAGYTPATKETEGGPVAAEVYIKKTDSRRRSAAEAGPVKQHGPVMPLATHADPTFEFRKVILMAETLLRKGPRKEGEEIIKRLIALSHELELFDERVQLYALVDLYHIKLQGIEANRKYRQEIFEITRRYHESVGAAAIFTGGAYMQLDSFSLKKHTETLNLLKNNYEATGYVRIGYYYHYSSLCFNAGMDNYKAAIFHGEQLLQLIHKNQRIFGGTGLETVTRKMAGCYLCSGNIKVATEKAYESIKLAVNHSQGQAEGMEMLFYTLLRRREFRTMGEITVRARRNQFVKQSRFYNGKWRMLQAALYFRSGDYKEALKLLKDCCGLPREYSEWVLYAQLLEVMCRAEMGQHEWFPYRAEALRKSIYRYESKFKNKRNGRIGLIYRLLKELSRNGQDYNLLLESELDAMDLLSCSEGNYFWNPIGPEIIRFEEWVQVKARKQGRKKGNKLVA